MRLLSEDFPLGLPAGPVFPKAYPEVEPDALSNVELFLQGQPFDIYARLRAEAPVAWQREGNNGPGFWALTQYNDVMRVDGDPKTFSSQKGGILMAYGPPETRHPLLFPRLCRRHDQHGCALAPAAPQGAHALFHT